MLDRSHAIVFLLLAIVLASTVQADEIPAAASTAVRYAAFVAMFVIVSQLLGDRVLQRRLAWTLSLAAAAAGLLAVYNFLGTHETLVAKPTYGDPNDLAFVLATTLPLTFWLLGESRYLRPLVLALIGAIGASIVLTFSRGALVGLAAAALWHFFTERRHVPILLVGLLIGAAGAATLIQSSPDRFEVGFEAKQSVAEENVQTRLDAWRAAARLAGEHPFLGVGPGNFKTQYAQLGETLDPADLNSGRPQRVPRHRRGARLRRARPLPRLPARDLRAPDRRGPARLRRARLRGRGPHGLDRRGGVGAVPVRAVLRALLADRRASRRPCGSRAAALDEGRVRVHAPGCGARHAPP